jgi:hypothetical protein
MPDNLRHRYAEAATAAHREWVPSTLENRADRRTLGERIAEAILAVRDEEMAELRERAEKAETELETIRASLSHADQTKLHLLCVSTTAFAQKISEKRDAIAQREQAVNDCRDALTRAEKAEEALYSFRLTVDRVVALARTLAATDPKMADLIAETIVNMPGECAPGAALALLDPLEPRRA